MRMSKKGKVIRTGAKILKAGEPSVKESAKQKGRAVYVEDPEEYKTKTPAWAFSRCDTEKWALCGCKEIYDSVIKKLGDFEGLTWMEIMSQSGGRSHGTNSHFEDVGELIREAQKRLRELHLDDLDQVFSLRLSGTERIYGILNDRVLRIIWYDPNHEIYPMSK